MLKLPKMLGAANVCPGKEHETVEIRKFKPPTIAPVVPFKHTSRLMPLRPKPVALVNTTELPVVKTEKPSGLAKKFRDAIRTDETSSAADAVMARLRPGKMQQLTPSLPIQHLTLPKPKSPEAPLVAQAKAPRSVTPRMKYIIDAPFQQRSVSPPEPDRIVEFLGCEGDARKYRIWIRK